MELPSTGEGTEFTLAIVTFVFICGFPVCLKACLCSALENEDVHCVKMSLSSFTSLCESHGNGAVHELTTRRRCCTQNKQLSFSECDLNRLLNKPSLLCLVIFAIYFRNCGVSGAILFWSQHFLFFSGFGRLSDDMLAPSGGG